MDQRFAAATTVEVTPPFDLRQSIRFLEGFTPCAGDHRCERAALVTGGFADRRPFLVRVPVPDAGVDATTELAVGVEWVDGGGDLDAVGAWLAAFLSLGDDLDPLYEAAAGDPAFERVVADLYGYHHVRFPTPFECACWAALSQRTPMALAARQKRTLVEAVGRVVERDGHRHRLFPTPGMVLDRESAVERALDNDRKVKTVLGAADLFAGTDLRGLSDDALEAKLRSVWGFGDWSSTFVLLRGFGRLIRVPSGEQRLRSVVAERYDLDREASEADLERLGERYGEFRGYWAHYLRVWAVQRDERGGR